MKGYIEIVVRDKDGKIVKHGKHEMHSFLNNLPRILLGMLSAVGGTGLTVEGLVKSATVVDQTGANATAYIEWYGTNGWYYTGGVVFGANAPDDDDTYGIIVGSGTTPLALDQYALVSKIAHGTGTGQLDYGVSSYTELGLDMGVSPPVYRFRLLRTFANLTGASININEVGIAVRCYWAEQSLTRCNVKFIIARDVLPTSYPIPAGGTATVTVTVEVEVG
jgi:hypothetical protein